MHPIIWLLGIEWEIGGTPGNTDVIGTVVNASTVSGSGGSGANITGSNSTYSTTIS